MASAFLRASEICTEIGVGLLALSLAIWIRCGKTGSEETRKRKGRCKRDKSKKEKIRSRRAIQSSKRKEAAVRGGSGHGCSGVFHERRGLHNHGGYARG